MMKCTAISSTKTSNVSLFPYLGIDCFSRLYSEYEFIPGCSPLFKNVPRDIPILNPDLSLAFIQGLSAPKVIKV